MASDLLVTPQDIEAWGQLTPGSLVNDVLAIRICNGVSVLVREAGSPDWTAATIPPRAKLIAEIKAKNYYLNPTSLVQEGVGPISERRLDEAVHNMALTEAERATLAELAGAAGTSDTGLWVQPTGRGDALIGQEDVFVTDQSGSDWMIPWARLDDHLYPREA